MKQSEPSYDAYSFILGRTSRRVKQYAQTQFKQRNFGVTVDQWTVLKQLHKEDGISQNELALKTFKDTPTLTRIIDLLCKKDLTFRSINEKDRRKFRVKLTDAGRKKAEELKPQIQEIRQKAWQGLSQDDFGHFKKVLDTIYSNLSEGNS